jgi:hypothetical protein
MVISKSTTDPAEDPGNASDGGFRGAPEWEVYRVDINGLHSSTEADPQEFLFKSTQIFFLIFSLTAKRLFL